MRHQRTRLAPLAAAAAMVLVPAAVPAGASTGPALSVPTGQLAAALACPDHFRSPHEPVLLVHGTATNSRDTWSWNYQRALPAMGYDVCTVDLPDRALGDIQVASEYVVHAIRAVAAASGRLVEVIGHSQGTVEPRWALKWWPDVRDLVDDYVSLAGSHHGASGADEICVTGSCAPAVQQLRTGSRFLAALDAGDETPGELSYTSVFSAYDELVQPYRTAALAGAANILIQDLCPGRPVHHGGFLHDAVVFAVVMDALDHPGPADPERFDPSTCLRGSMPGVQEPLTGNATLYGPAALAVARHEKVPEEPPLAPYARGSSG